ncbi:nucleoside deaminase [Pararhodonellum marinum]|uniref:nucleoside deaminase n=1 Tax=Pararhodonellum marinum TaxID=2755358 RepID=UPI001890423B|nr:nucleoside deaminase [Pararhodonellum marinum]
MTEAQQNFMKKAIALAREGMVAGKGGPFGCVIVKDGVIVGEGSNSVLDQTDPTAHAEVVAIRNACKNLGDFQLDGCELYTSCEPCPMCLGAIYWARPTKVFFACNKDDAAEAGFDDDFIYKELDLPHAKRKIPMEQLLRSESQEVFKLWVDKNDKTVY